MLRQRLEPVLDLALVDDVARHVLDDEHDERARIAERLPAGNVGLFLQDTGICVNPPGGAYALGGDVAGLILLALVCKLFV